MATPFDEIAQAASSRMIEALFPMLERLRWDQPTLAAHRTSALRDALAFARKRSAWHGARLASIDLSSVTPDGLSALPTMTKADLMDNWDAIVTDDRLDLALARLHLRDLDESGPSFLLGEYLVFTTGGTTGEPGVFAWSIDEMSRWGASMIRFGVDGGLPPPDRLVHVAARSPRHVSSMVPLLLYGSTIGSELIVPVDQPPGAIVDELNRIQPSALWVVSSMLGPLADAACSGALHIEVDRISVGGDMLDPSAVDAAEEAFGVRPMEGYPTTDVGHIAVQAPGARWMTTNDDLMIVEAVDADDRPTEPGELSHHILVTSLHQRTLPLVRYRIDDSVCMATTPGRYPAFSHVAAIIGRTDELFTYDDVTVHPHVVRSVITQHPGIIDYEVRQIPMGADVRVVARPGSQLELDALARDLRQRLEKSGVTEPRVVVGIVDELERSAVGKRRHFVALGASPDHG